jgi:hypothetical protein
MKSGWFIVILVGVLASLVRLAGPASLADIAAVAYLLAATVVFDRGKRHAPARAHTARSEQSLRV